jgi:hypothetical protein
VTAGSSDGMPDSILSTDDEPTPIAN